MFIQEAPGIAWSRTVHGRGFRPEETKVGYYVIEHIATGKLVTGHSAKVSEDLDKIFDQLMAKAYPNKKLQAQYDSDMDLKIHEFRSTSIKAAKKSEATLRETVTPRYLLLN